MLELPGLLPEGRLAAEAGAAGKSTRRNGLAATPERFALRGLGARTPIRGLYLTGQDVATLGVVGAMYGGVIGASAALGKNLFTVVHKAREGARVESSTKRCEA